MAAERQCPNAKSMPPARRQFGLSRGPADEYFAERMTGSCGIFRSGKARLHRRVLCFLALCCSGLAGGSTAVFGQSYLPLLTWSTLTPPPPAPPVSTRAAAALRWRTPQSEAPNRYSIGEPTDEEQAYLEFINRARANPTAEGLRLQATTDPQVVNAYDFFRVNLALMASQLAGIAPAPPLAFNLKLLTAARGHSADMFTNAFQAHTGTDGRGLSERATAQGYAWQRLGENVYSNAASVVAGHAAFEVDWGGSAATGGMQSPPGHRNSIHDPRFREIGIGVVLGSNGGVGPQWVTQDFGADASNKPLLSGVAYYDFNTNGFYDPGEGIGGVTVTVSGANFSAVTANSGGYTVPLPGDGTFTVAFSAAGLPVTARTVVVAGGVNVKADFVPAYAPPVIGGGTAAFLHRSNVLSFSPVGAATGYRVEQTRLVPYAAVEGAENGTNGVVAEISAGYAVITTAVHAGGAASFHLAMPVAKDQFLTLRPILRLGANSQLTFASRLNWATSGQIARAQLSPDDGVTWLDLWTQAGTGDSGDARLVTRSVSLAGFAGRNARVRFAYMFTGGSFFPQTDATVGYLVDDIAISDAQEVVSPVVTEIPGGTAFVFSPTNTTGCSFRVQAQIGTRWLGFGPTKDYVVVPAPTVQLAARRPPTGNQVQFDIGLTGGTAGRVMAESAPEIGGPYSPDPTAVLETITTGNEFRITAPLAGARRFYRVVVMP